MPADDPGALSQGIQGALSAPTRVRDRAAAAVKKAGTWSIAQRAQAVIDKCALPLGEDGNHK